MYQMATVCKDISPEVKQKWKRFNWAAPNDILYATFLSDISKLKILWASESTSIIQQKEQEKFYSKREKE